MLKSRCFSLVLAVLFASSCQSIRKHPSRETGKEPARPSTGGAPPPATTPSSPAERGDDEEVPEEVTSAPEPTPVPVTVQRPRLALILGPGGLRAYAHAGLLQELAKAKIPVYWVGGMEMGALPAALFALKGQPFEAEWQMMKLKEDDLIRKGLLGGAGPLKADTLAEPLKLMFGGARAEDAKIPYMCSSYSAPKKQTFMMNRGSLAQMLMYCLPSPPLFEPYQGSGANPLALGSLAQTARAKGAQLVVYVDLLSENAFADADQGFIWGLFQQGIEAQAHAATETVRIGGLAGLRSFERRREMLQKGQEAGRRLVQTLQRKYGF